MGNPFSVTVVIPTVCSQARETGLLRAVTSALAASRREVQVLAIVNGPHVNPSTLHRLEASGARVMHQEEGSPLRARALGRSAIETDTFAFLDDDDELLPGALDRRAEMMQGDPAADVVVSNGFMERNGQLRPAHDSMAGVAEAPLETLLARNWLASCAALFRSATVEPEFFHDAPGYGEWTWLGFRLCVAQRGIRTLEAMDYIVHDTPRSLSKSEAYHESYVPLFDRMLAAEPPAWARPIVHGKRCAALHDLSVRAMRSGRWRESLQLHVRSLRPPHGLKYFAYGRHILANALRLAA